jgi:hypothetical protein
MQLGQSEAKGRVRSKKSTWHETRTNFVFFRSGGGNMVFGPKYEPLNDS